MESVARHFVFVLMTVLSAGVFITPVDCAGTNRLDSSVRTCRAAAGGCRMASMSTSRLSRADFLCWDLYIYERTRCAHGGVRRSEKGGLITKGTYSERIPGYFCFDWSTLFLGVS